MLCSFANPVARLPSFLARSLVISKQVNVAH